MKKAFKYRLYPTRKQADALQETLDLCREIYNAALLERKEAYRMSKISVSYEIQSAQLPQIKEGEHKDLSVRIYVCIHCGLVLDRDQNAAINILDRGLGRSLRQPVSPGTFQGAIA